MTRLLGLALLLGVWLIGCGDDKNYLYGSIEQEYGLSLDFDSVKIEKNASQLTISYLKKYAVQRCNYSIENDVLIVTLERIPAETELKNWLDFKSSIKIDRSVLTLPAMSCMQDQVQQQSFPEKLTVTEASVIVSKVGAKPGDAVEGEFRVRFGGSTLNGGFQGKSAK